MKWRVIVTTDEGDSLDLAISEGNTESWTKFWKTNGGRVGGEQERGSTSGIEKGIPPWVYPPRVKLM